MADNLQCPQCGQELPPDAPLGLCPKCVLNMGVDTRQETQPESRPEADGSSWTAFVPPAPEELVAYFPQLEILELLGQGGMGAVYKARQGSLDRLVALKILRPSLGEDPAFAERFAREARSLARLNHPNIVGVYDFGQAGGFYYLLMEYVDGVNLRHMAGREPLASKEAMAIVPQICDALQFAHDEGIVHRDVKPENILIDTKGRVKIADFGLAKLLARTPTDYTLTQPQQVMGTPHYMAPEQVEHPATVDQRADIYSLGVVFYEMLTGELPIGRFAPPSKKVEIDVRLDEVVLHALENEPDRRYQQVSQVKTDVEHISSTVILPAPVGDPPDREALASAARSSILPPAIGMLVVGAWASLRGGSEFIDWMVSTLAHKPTYFGPSLPLAAAVCGAVAILGSVRMMKMKSYGLAVAGSVAVIAAGVVRIRPESIVLALAVGIWALAVLLGAGVQVGFGLRVEPRRLTAARTPRSQVKGPAIALLTLGLFHCVIGTIWLWMRQAWAPTLTNLPEIAVGVAAWVLGLLLIVAALRLMRLKGYRFAFAAGILAMAPLPPFFLVGLPVGIWALVVLRRPEVKAAFAVAQRPDMGRQTRTAWIVAALIIGALAVPIGIVVVQHLLPRPTGQQSVPDTAPSEGPGGVTVLYGGSDWEGLITKTGVEIDRVISSSSTNSGTSLKVVADSPTVVRLFEHGPTTGMYAAGPWDVDNSRLIYHANLRAFRLQGQAYLEMRLHFPDGQEFVSRGLDTAVSGTKDWTSVETSFDVKGQKEPDNVKLNLVIDGTGVVWIDRVTLSLESPSNVWGAHRGTLVEPAKPATKALGESQGLVLDLGKGVTMKLALIPAGKFMMGAPDSENGHCVDEEPVHEVTIAKPFYLGVYEVTQEQYAAIMASSLSFFRGKTNPVEMVTWGKAMEFCKKLSEKTGKSVRLPTEAEWEYACRAGTTTRFHTGATIGTDQANYDGSKSYGKALTEEFRQKTVPVGSFKPNGFGLYDMHGNVAEWCSDWYDEKYYGTSPKADPPGPRTGTSRVLRGGSWKDGPVDCRSTCRDSCELDVQNAGVIGFRVAVVRF